MRTAFIQQLYNLAKVDSRINLIVGDLGFGVVTDFARDFPNQFLNAGVAEQNMTGGGCRDGFIGQDCVYLFDCQFPHLALSGANS